MMELMKRRKRLTEGEAQYYTMQVSLAVVVPLLLLLLCLILSPSSLPGLYPISPPIPLPPFSLPQVIRALAYLHRNNVIHRDMKLGNLFLTGDLQIKVRH